MASGASDDTSRFAAYAASVTADSAAWKNTLVSWKQTRVLYSSILGQLGYGTGPFTWNYGPREQTALSSFQRDLELPVTGQLDRGSIAHLLEAQKALAMADIKLPGLTVSRNGQSFTANGTWKAVGNKVGYPVNTTNIECDAVTGTCEVTTVDFISDRLDQVGGIRAQSFRVAQWADDILIARGEEDSDVTLVINVPAKDVTWTQKGTGTTLRLVDGMQLSPPFDGGDLKAEHDALFKAKERYLALQAKNMLVR